MATERFRSWLLTAICLPFFVGGIFAAIAIAGLATGTGWNDRSTSFFVLAICLVPVGVFGGALIAYGVVVFFAVWLRPGDQWASFTEVKGGAPRVFNRPFRAMYLLAARLAPKGAKPRG